MNRLIRPKFLRKSKSLAAGLFTAAALTASAVAVAADEFPNSPLTMIVSYTAGGATDFQARIATSKAEEYLGASAAIINRPGAGGQIGWNYLVQKGKEDGYDLAAYNVPHFIAQSLIYDTYYNIDNLEPIANWGADPAVLIVDKDSPFDTIEDLVTYAKENPSKVTVSGAGLFVGHHIAALQLEKAADIKLKYIPTSGGVDALRFVQGKQVMAGFNNLSDAYRSRDRLKILGIADLERNQTFVPDVPTFREAGYEIDDASVNFRGVMTRSGVPEERLEYLSGKMVAMFNDDAIKAQMEKGGATMRVMNRSDLKDMWQRRQAFLSELFEEIDAKELAKGK